MEFWTSSLPHEENMEHLVSCISVQIKTKPLKDYIDTRFLVRINVSSSLLQHSIEAINFQPEDVHILEIFRMAEEKEMCLSFPIE